MKKMVAVLLTALMVISLSACAEDNSTESTPPEVISEPENHEGTSETTPANEPAKDTAGSEAVNEAEGVKILVAYFSATNTTKGVAEQIADSLSADLYEIVPKQPYTDEDLDYRDDNSRTTIEMNDAAARPAISGSVDNMEQYAIVFIGYPIWLAYHNLIQCTQA